MITYEMITEEIKSVCLNCLDDNSIFQVLSPKEFTDTLTDLPTWKLVVSTPTSERSVTISIGSPFDLADLRSGVESWLKETE